jgi:hypothetical protein
MMAISIPSTSAIDRSGQSVEHQAHSKRHLDGDRRMDRLTASFCGRHHGR